MSLTPTQAWTDAAKSGTAKPTLLMEFKPTVFYDEVTYGDWASISDNNDLNVKSKTGELMLQAKVQT